VEFRVDRSIGSAGLAEIAVVAMDAVRYIDTKVVASTNYNYRVRAIGRTGGVAPSIVVSVNTPATATESKIVCKTFGTASDVPNNSYDRALDGNTSTYFRGKDATGVYVGMNCGDAGYRVSRIRYAPLANYLQRMVGGKFQGSNASSTTGFVDLHTITVAPPTGYTSVPLTGTATYKYLRYLSPDNSFGTVAEVEFYTKL
jgi:hypothetical protein